MVSDSVFVYTMAARLLLVSAVLVNVASCFSLSASDAAVTGGGGAGGSSVLLPVVEEGRPAGPSRSEVVRAWLRSLMTSQPSSGRSRIGVQRRMILDDTDDDVERDNEGQYVGDRHHSVLGERQSTMSRWTSPRRRQLSAVSMLCECKI